MIVNNAPRVRGARPHFGKPSAPRCAVHASQLQHNLTARQSMLVAESCQLDAIDSEDGPLGGHEKKRSSVRRACAGPRLSVAGKSAASVDRERRLKGAAILGRDGRAERRTHCADARECRIVARLVARGEREQSCAQICAATTRQPLQTLRGEEKSSGRYNAAFCCKGSNKISCERRCAAPQLHSAPHCL